MTNHGLPCPLWRRLMAIFYDAILLFCLVFIAWQPLPLIPDSFWPTPLVGQMVRLAYLFGIIFLFLGWFWTHGGQTLGMRAWQVAVQGIDGNNVSWSAAWHRFIVSGLSWAIFGLGFVWSLFDSQSRTWHDIASDTRLLIKPRKSRAAATSQTGTNQSKDA